MSRDTMVGCDDTMSVSSTGTTNANQFVRDLQDALERETDLRDQLKFAEEDMQSTHKRLQDVETENEGLLKQLAKLTTATGRGRPPMQRSARCVGHRSFLS